MATTTTNLGLTKPAVNSAVDEDLWGGQLNTDLDLLDSEAATATINKNFADKVVSRPEIKDYAETLKTDTSSSNVWTVDFTDGNHHEIVLTENVTTLTLSNPPATGKVGMVVLYIEQNGTGGFTVAFPSKVKFAGGIAPTITTTANRTDIVTLITRDGGTTYAGFTSGQNFAGL